MWETNFSDEEKAIYAVWETYEAKTRPEILNESFYQNTTSIFAFFLNIDFFNTK